MGYKERYALQLGMNPATAGHRLTKDLLFNFVKDTPCCHCDKLMTRENFSIEHEVPWRNADNALELFFDLDNVKFAHHACNMAQARRNRVSKEHTKLRKAANQRRVGYDSKKRRERYLRIGS